MRTLRILIAIASFGLAVGAASAGTEINTFPDTSDFSLAMTASVAQQANVTLPSALTFNITNVNSPTTTTAAVSITNIVLTSGNYLAIYLEPQAATFTGATGATYDPPCTDVSWSAGTWTNGTGAANTLTANTFEQVAQTSAANEPSLANNTLTFTFAQDANINIAGSYTLACTWKVDATTTP